MDRWLLKLTNKIAFAIVVINHRNDTLLLADVLLWRILKSNFIIFVKKFRFVDSLHVFFNFIFVLKN